MTAGCFFLNMVVIHPLYFQVHRHRPVNGDNNVGGIFQTCTVSLIHLAVG